MGISRLDHSRNAPYDRHLAYILDPKGRPLRTELIHDNLPHLNEDTPSNVTFTHLPAKLHDPRWNFKKQKWQEGKISWGRITFLVIVILGILFLAINSHAQTPVAVTGVPHGTSTTQQATVTCVDANHCAIDVNVAAGGGTGGGPADVAPNAAASESDAARQKDTSAIRLLDTAQAAGSQMVTAKGDQTFGMYVNCKAGCSSASDTTGSTVALNALNAAATVALVGTNSASVFIAGAGNLVGTLVPEVSNDNGTTWFISFFEDPSSHALTTSQVVSSPAATMLGILLPGGATNARVRVSLFTSGSSNGTLHAVAQFPNRPIKVSALGVVSVDGSATTQPISAASLPLPSNAAQETGGNLAALAGIVSSAKAAVKSADGDLATIGAKADAKAAQTDATPLTAIQILKEISFLLQNNLGVTGTFFQATQPVSCASGATCPVNATLSAETTKNIGTIRVTGNVGGVLDAIGQNVAAPANWLAMGCTFFTTPTTITNGDGSYLECDSAGNILVNLKTALPTGANTIGKVDLLGNSAVALDAAIGAAAPANVLAEGLKDTAGNSQAALSDTNGRQIVKQYPDTTTTSYHASKKFAASSTTDVAVMPGNATNKVILDKVTLTCTQTTAAQINVELLKRSVADTVGTSAAMTAVPDYSAYAGAISAPLSYTGTGPTVGAAVGDLDNAQIGCMASATATPNDIYVFKPAKPIILNGTAEQVAINLGGALTGGNITVTFDWRETTTP